MTVYQFKNTEILDSRFYGDFIGRNEVVVPRYIKRHHIGGHFSVDEWPTRLFPFAGRTGPKQGEIQCWVILST